MRFGKFCSASIVSALVFMISLASASASEAIFAQGQMGDLHFFDEGVVRFGYNMYVEGDAVSNVPGFGKENYSGYSIGSITLNVETRVMGLRTLGGHQGVGAWVLPIEVTVRGVGNNGALYMPALRLGLARLFIAPASLTIQMLSYVLNSYEVQSTYGYNSGSAKELEIASVAWTGATVLKDGDDYKIVYTLAVSGGFGKLAPGYNKMTDQPYYDIPGFKMPDGVDFSGKAYGSIGLQINPRILVDVFGGVSYDGARGTQEDVDSKLSMLMSYVGVGYHMSLTRKVSLHIKVDVEQYDEKLRYKTDAIDYQADFRRRAITGQAIFQYSW